MVLTYAKLRPYYPDVERLHLEPSSLESELARLRRPPALPYQCKPWLDARRLGFLVRYPYEAPLRVVGRSDGRPDFAYESHGVTARAGGPVVSAFATSHFSMRAGYRFRTSRPFSLMTTGVAACPSERLRVVAGVVETWWYPRPLFIVFENPSPSEELVFSPGDPLCVLVPVVLEPLEVREMTDDEENKIIAEDEKYQRDAAKLPGLAWTSLEGVGFSRRYKVFSKRARGEVNPPGEPRRPLPSDE